MSRTGGTDGAQSPADLAKEYGRLAEIRDELSPGMFEAMPPQGEERYLRNEYRERQQRIADAATEFLRRHGFKAGGLRKAK